MKILVTNDDGIYAPGLWALVEKLAGIAEVTVVAPDREQSAIGTAITLHHPLRVQEVRSEVAGVKSYAVGGTPGDSVIMAIGHLAKNDVDLVVSGINNGPNLGTDVFQSGTVGGAMQGFMHGLSGMAVSIDAVDSAHLSHAAGMIVPLVRKITGVAAANKYLLNVNVPDVPATEIMGVRITQLDSTTLADTVEEGHDGRRHYYWLRYNKVQSKAAKFTDVWAVNRKYISVTPLHYCLFNRKLPDLKNHFSGLLADIRSSVTDY
jgi:5'-nucleotidase